MRSSINESTYSGELRLHRSLLPNGLRILLAPDGTAPVVGVSVHYGVGFRSEPQGRSGFAHLFEHLMFQGSESLKKLSHSRYVQGAGGKFNGITHQDYTSFFEVLPSVALERALFLEADRMRAPRITEKNIRTQVAVVREEILNNIDSKPYGGIPWIHLPPVMYQDFSNSHNGYGELEDLAGITVDECVDFFSLYYSPANAVLTVVGDLDVDRTLEMIHHHFADISERPPPSPPLSAEQPLCRERYGWRADALAPAPALAAGYRLPDPLDSFRFYSAHLAISHILCGRPTSRFRERLVQEGSAIAAESACGLFGKPFDARDPDTLTVVVTHPSAVGHRKVTTALDQELERLATVGPTPGELASFKALWRARLYREHDDPSSRMLRLGAFELLYGRANAAVELPHHINGVTADDVASAARGMRPETRGVLLVEPRPRSTGNG
ncbi:pitrilysin family protein [Nocardiopsis rhodophaea]|uniref:Pitrilysin family protein n=1 Tax=Nocardiopsis rhodophaea TaxID=280238 RepID=A0ABN2TC30_9ACTN